MILDQLLDGPMDHRSLLAEFMLDTGVVDMPVDYPEGARVPCPPLASWCW